MAKKTFANTLSLFLIEDREREVTSLACDTQHHCRILFGLVHNGERTHASTRMSMSSLLFLGNRMDHRSG